MRRGITGIFAVAMALGLAACDEGTDPRFGTVSVLLTDAPGDVVEAYVTITDIYMQGHAGDDDPPTSRVYLMEGGAETFELLSLSNDVAEVVREVQVPTGSYGQLRIVVSGACIVTEAGNVYASDGYGECGPSTGRLHMPSIQQTGIKVLMQGFQVTSGQHAVLLDFDVSQSFGRQAGNSGMWVMNPVIHGAEFHEAASLRVILTAADGALPDTVGLDEFAVLLTPEVGDPAEAWFVDVDGTYRASFPYLLAGNGPFALALVPPEGYEATFEGEVTASPASASTLDIHWVLQSLTEVEEDDD
jgi:hypothetical protein